MGHARKRECLKTFEQSKEGYRARKDKEQSRCEDTFGTFACRYEPSCVYVC